VRRPPRWGVVFAAVFLVLLLAAAALPTLFTAADPLATTIANALQPPSLAHPFGTDQSGRDVFARVIYGVRTSLLIALVATALAVVLGMLVGTLAGLAPRALAGVISRMLDIVLAFPEFLLALLTIAILGPGVASLTVAIALSAMPVYARVSRIQVLTVKGSAYVRAAVALGVSPRRIVLRHIVPNTIRPLVVMATMGCGTAIATAAGLSFLGLGPVPPTPEWGVIVSEGRNFLGTAWWISVFPGLMITVTVIAASVLGRHAYSRRSGGRP
jgi:peptide/nickel transport system permease protein